MNIYCCKWFDFFVEWPSYIEKRRLFEKHKLDFFKVVRVFVCFYIIELFGVFGLWVLFPTKQ